MTRLVCGLTFVLMLSACASDPKYAVRNPFLDEVSWMLRLAEDAIKLSGKIGGLEVDRTPDFFRVKEALYR